MIATNLHNHHHHHHHHHHHYHHHLHLKMSSIIPSIPSNPLPNFTVIVTKEEFNLFYSVDRQLFTRLLIALGREISQSINVMAFLMWLERKSKYYNLVANIHQQWSDVMLSNLADEAVVILNCIGSSHYPSTFVGKSKLPLIQHICRFNVTLEFFHEKRLEVITGVTKIINDVCVRAFTDIIEKVNYDRTMKEQDLYLASIYGDVNIATHIQSNMVPFSPNVIPMMEQQIDVPQVNEILANLNLDDIYIADTGIVTSPGNGDDKRNEIKKLVDDRTLFMTFSKGYPISENEIREFFTRYPFSFFICLLTSLSLSHTHTHTHTNLCVCLIYLVLKFYQQYISFIFLLLIPDISAYFIDYLYMNFSAYISFI